MLFSRKKKKAVSQTDLLALVNFIPVSTISYSKEKYNNFRNGANLEINNVRIFK